VWRWKWKNEICLSGKGLEREETEEEYVEFGFWIGEMKGKNNGENVEDILDK